MKFCPLGRTVQGPIPIPTAAFFIRRVESLPFVAGVHVLFRGCLKRDVPASGAKKAGEDFPFVQIFYKLS